jgi:hypothetical protein
MTKSQIKKLEWVEDQVECLKKDHWKNGEIKNYEVSENVDYDFIDVYICVGAVGDETNAAYLVRESAHFFIGKRGAITYYDRKQKKRTLGKYEGLLTIHCAQNHKYD